MNPYKEIARRHLTTEELEELLAERKKPAPKKMSEYDLEYNRLKNIILKR